MVFPQVCAVWLGGYGRLCWVYGFARKPKTRQILEWKQVSSCTFCLCFSKHKKQKEEEKCMQFDTPPNCIYISSNSISSPFLDLCFFSFRVDVSSEFVSLPICSHSDNHRSRMCNHTSGLPCQLWLIVLSSQDEKNLFLTTPLSLPVISFALKFAGVFSSSASEIYDGWKNTPPKQRIATPRTQGMPESHKRWSQRQSD